MFILILLIVIGFVLSLSLLFAVFATFGAVRGDTARTFTEAFRESALILTFAVLVIGVLAGTFFGIYSVVING